MVAEKFIPIEPDSEVDRFIMQARERPIVTASHGMRFRIVRDQTSDLFADYDPERVLAALADVRGILAGVDIEKLKQDLREERGQDSIGRPDWP